MVLPVKKRSATESNNAANQNSRSISTQTEEQDPICARGENSYFLSNFNKLFNDEPFNNRTTVEPTPNPGTFPSELYSNVLQRRCL